MRDESYKWRLLAFLFVAFFLVMGTRQLYNAVLPQIKLEFAGLGISDALFGAVGTVFSATFGVLVVVSGLAADFLGRKRVLVAGTLVFSLGIFLSGFAGGIGALMVFYGALNAAGQCCVAPASYGLISKYHVGSRATAMAIFQGAVYSGVILSSLFGGGMSELGHGAWRWAFWTMGGIGIAWALAMAFALKPEPPAGAQTGGASVREAFSAMLKKPTAVAIALAFGCFNYARLGLLLWIAVFLTRSFEGVGVAKAAFHGVFWLNAGALASCLLTARALDRLAPSFPRARLATATAGMLLCAAPMTWIAASGSFASCCAALAALGLAVGVYEAANYPAMFDCIEPRYRSAATGITGCLAFLLGSPAPLALGWIGERLSQRAGFLSLCAFYLLGFAILLAAFMFFYNKDRVAEARGKGGAE